MSIFLSILPRDVYRGAPPYAFGCLINGFIPFKAGGRLSFYGVEKRLTGTPYLSKGGA